MRVYNWWIIREYEAIRLFCFRGNAMRIVNLLLSEAVWSGTEKCSVEIEGKKHLRCELDYKLESV